VLKRYHQSSSKRFESPALRRQLARVPQTTAHDSILDGQERTNIPVHMGVVPRRQAIALNPMRTDKLSKSSDHTVHTLGPTSPHSTIARDANNFTVVKSLSKIRLGDPQHGICGLNMHMPSMASRRIIAPEPVSFCPLSPACAGNRDT